jgi:hypothetical protein
MAQTRERNQPAEKSPTPTKRRAPTTSPPTSAPRRNLLSWLRPPLTDAPTGNASANGRPPRRTLGQTFKSFFGIILWFVASQFILYGLYFLDSAMHGGLQNTHFAPPNTPLLGGITPFLLLYGGGVIGLWFLLIRLNIIPRDFFGGRAQAEARARRQAAAASTASSGASTGPRKTRAQRRYSETQAVAKAQANTKGGKSSAKPAARTGSNGGAKASDSAKAPAATSGTHDIEYDQVRSADRLRRRRAKR